MSLILYIYVYIYNESHVEDFYPDSFSVSFLKAKIDL